MIPVSVSQLNYFTHDAHTISYLVYVPSRLINQICTYTECYSFFHDRDSLSRLDRLFLILPGKARQLEEGFTVFHNYCHSDHVELYGGSRRGGR